MNKSLNKPSTVVTRFAPSPTGNLHIGGARTALYAYLWAKQHKGTFMLRIEDTDQARYQADAEQSIYNGLKWLGIEWEGEVVHQSTRTEIYQTHAKTLLDAGKAYYCFCTAEQLETMREIQRKKGRAPKYDKRCSRLTPEEVQEKISNADSKVIRLNIPEEGSIVVEDVVRGKIEFQLAELDDQILVKSDGFPTYHLANVVDDHAAGITYVIRGEEWIPSTPKHVLLYQAFGWQAPQFAHLSLFINKGGGKLSKREGAKSVLAYKDAGYLPEAVVNFIALLGWNPKTEQEVFSMDELIAAFDLTQINTANPIFDEVKLDWFNAQYIRTLPLNTVTEYCMPYLPTAEYDYIQRIVALEQDRIKKFSEIAEVTTYFFTDHLEYSIQDIVWKKNTPEQTKQYLEEVAIQLEQQTDWSTPTLEQNIIEWIKSRGYGNGDVLWPLRYALTAQKASPSPFQVAAVLGREKTIHRIQQAISVL